MKTIKICIFLSILFYIGCSFVGLSFNPMEWKDEFGRAVFIFVLMAIWVFPISLSYLNGDKIFED